MKRKVIKALINKVDKASATLDAVFSTSDEDRHGDIVEQNWDLDAFKQNPVLLNSHKAGDATEVVGNVKPIRVENGKLQGKVHFAVNENPKAKVIFDLYAGGFLKAFSVGFQPKEFDDENPFRILKSELLEISAVPVGANPQAFAKARKKGIDVSALEDEDERKANKSPASDAGVVNQSPASDGGIQNTAPIEFKNKTWDELDEAEKKEVTDKLKWYNESLPDDLSELKLERFKDIEIEDIREKDVHEAIAIAQLVDTLDFLIFAFDQNDVSERTIEKMKSALSLLMRALHEQSVQGQKEMSQTEKVVKATKNLLHKKRANRDKVIKALGRLVEELQESEKGDMTKTQEKIEKKKLNQAIRNLIEEKTR